MCTFGIFCGLSFSYILMTHATAPRSARTLAQARPTMSCIHLVMICPVMEFELYSCAAQALHKHYMQHGVQL